LLPRKSVKLLAGSSLEKIEAEHDDDDAEQHQNAPLAHCDEEANAKGSLRHKLQDALERVEQTEAKDMNLAVELLDDTADRCDIEILIHTAVHYLLESLTVRFGSDLTISVAQVNVFALCKDFLCKRAQQNILQSLGSVFQLLLRLDLGPVRVQATKPVSKQLVNQMHGSDLQQHSETSKHFVELAQSEPQPQLSIIIFLSQQWTTILFLN